MNEKFSISIVWCWGLHGYLYTRTPLRDHGWLEITSNVTNLRLLLCCQKVRSICLDCSIPLILSEKNVTVHVSDLQERSNQKQYLTAFRSGKQKSRRGVAQNCSP